jgi:hypothetical protein
VLVSCALAIAVGACGATGPGEVPAVDPTASTPDNRATPASQTPPVTGAEILPVMAPLPRVVDSADLRARPVIWRSGRILDRGNPPSAGYVRLLGEDSRFVDARGQFQLAVPADGEPRWLEVGCGERPERAFAVIATEAQVTLTESGEQPVVLPMVQRTAVVGDITLPSACTACRPGIPSEWTVDAWDPVDNEGCAGAIPRGCRMSSPTVEGAVHAFQECVSPELAAVCGGEAVFYRAGPVRPLGKAHGRRAFAVEVHQMRLVLTANAKGVPFWTTIVRGSHHLTAWVRHECKQERP